jgi:NADH-quinone oxidoreductase subunit I
MRRRVSAINGARNRLPEVETLAIGAAGGILVPFELKADGCANLGSMANIGEVLENAAAIAKGMSITFKEMLSPTLTEEYPDGPVHFQERFRGAHVLQRDENGLEKCVACFLCAAACPSNCIYIEAEENTKQLRISGGERYAKVYNIDYNRCIFCGYCVEACPTDAITHGHGFELASYNTANLIIRKEQMLAPLPPGVSGHVSAPEEPHQPSH